MLWHRVRRSLKRYATARRIGPLTVQAWIQERADVSAKRAECPACGRMDNYSTYEIDQPGTTSRKYRGCKLCGFWQEADGRSLPYRTVLTVHVCIGPISENSQCSSCLVWGPRAQHCCFRVLRRAEAHHKEYLHSECGVRIGMEHVIPWPVEWS